MSENEAPRNTKPKAFVLRLPEELYDRLEKWADMEMRSVNNLMVWALARAVEAHEEETEYTGGNQSAEVYELAA